MKFKAENTYKYNNNKTYTYLLIIIIKRIFTYSDGKTGGKLFYSFIFIIRHVYLEPWEIKLRSKF